MTTLLINVPVQSVDVSSETKFGGKPSAPAGTVIWPKCAYCKENMQFLGQLRPENSTELLLLFMCQNNPGSCEEWDANAGGNKVVTVSANDLQVLEPPATGDTLRPTHYGARIVEHEEVNYDAARTVWAASEGVSPRQVLGQAAGSPVWLQNEETPTCDACGAAMQFVAQLEEGPDHKTAMNFGGGGCAYVFRCRCNSRNGKFLWQC